jgi:hypothetical protein
VLACPAAPVFQETTRAKEKSFMPLWTFAICLLTATTLLVLRSYLAHTSTRLKMHLVRIDLLKRAVDDPLEVARGHSPLISLERLAAGFALSDARSDCLEAQRWLENAEDIQTDNGPRPPGRLKAGELPSQPGNRIDRAAKSQIVAPFCLSATSYREIR